MIAPTIVLCSECQHENESERIYCHHCGARLDRTQIPATKEPAQDAHKRIKKMFDPRRARFRALSIKIAKVLLAAAAAAVVILIALPPDVPAPSTALVLGSALRSQVEGMTGRNQPPQVDLTQDQINSYLFSTLKIKRAALNLPLIDFNRAFVTFQEQLGTFTVERSVYGYSLYTSVGYEAESSGGKLAPKVKAGHLGRLPIHPVAMQYATFFFSDVFDVLRQEARLLGKCGAIDFHDQHIVMDAPAR
jgi:hypothetical protein